MTETQHTHPNARGFGPLLAGNVKEAHGAILGHRQHGALPCQQNGTSVRACSSHTRSTRAFTNAKERCYKGVDTSLVPITSTTPVWGGEHGWVGAGAAEHTDVNLTSVSRREGKGGEFRAVPVSQPQTGLRAAKTHNHLGQPSIREGKGGGGHCTHIHTTAAPSHTQLERRVRHAMGKTMGLRRGRPYRTRNTVAGRQHRQGQQLDGESLH